MPPPCDFDDAPSATTALDLPEFYRGLLVRPRCQPPQPEHARAEACLRGTVIKEKPRLALQLGCVEGVGHDQEDIDVVRRAFSRHERSEDDESRQVAGRLSDAVDSGEAQSQSLALVGANTEPVQDLAQGSYMHSERQLAVFGQRR